MRVELDFHLELNSLMGKSTEKLALEAERETHFRPLWADLKLHCEAEFVCNGF
jgi:hypothetical protein